MARSYFEGLCREDMSNVDGVRRNETISRLLLRSYARNIAQQVSMATIRKDMLANDSSTLDENTVVDYIKALKKLYVIEDLPAWNPNIRSKAAIRTSDTRHFVDPSVGTAALGLGPKDLINDLQSFGLLFEDLVVRDLRVYAEALDGSLYHYSQCLERGLGLPLCVYPCFAGEPHQSGGCGANRGAYSAPALYPETFFSDPEYLVCSDLVCGLQAYAGRHRQGLE